MEIEAPYEVLVKKRDAYDAEADRLRQMLLEMEREAKNLEDAMKDVNERMKAALYQRAAFDQFIREAERGWYGGYYSPFS